MSSILPFPTPERMRAADDVLADDDQVQAMKAMLRYLHREAGESRLTDTAAAISQALQALEIEVDGCLR